MSAAKSLVMLLVVLETAVCTTDSQERIKMCGRDLIRLAVSSCGNSRLSRSLSEVEGSQSSSSKMDQQMSAKALWMARPPPGSGDDGDGFSLVPRWYPVSPRFRRSAGKISDLCCEIGCSMKELIQFC
uniref:Insulin n=1 Tax=Tetraodon nigroviridis TaxID=99883 RepID=H3D0F9_TETNG